MGFARARTSEQKQQRMEDILEATAHLYETVPYEEITFASIAKKTGFARSNLYIYFTSKEEILLKLLSKDFESIHQQLEAAFHVRKHYSLEEIAEKWAESIGGNQRFLSLASIMFTLLEKNVSVDALAEFKVDVNTYQQDFFILLQGLFPDASEQAIAQFLTNQMALAQGLFPMTQLTPHQQEAIDQSGTHYEAPSFIQSYQQAIYLLLKGLV